MEDDKGHYQRLGKRELGPHAFEGRMPDRTAATIAAESDSNTLTCVVPRLARLLEYDNGIEVAYLCHGSAVQIYKLSQEGNHFCGYRNLQMLLLALGRSGTCDSMHQKYTIPQLQYLIERAWDEGFNSHGRNQTGGIEGSRKHIGTPEAEALLLSRGVSCTGTAFSGREAWRELLDSIEAYFARSLSGTLAARVHITNCLPLFLQRPDHSITVVGVERMVSGKRRLLTFDPAYHPPRYMKGQRSQIGHQKSEVLGKWSARLTLSLYRKNESYLKRYKAFETLTLDPAIQQRQHENE